MAALQKFMVAQAPRLCCENSIFSRTGEKPVPRLWGFGKRCRPNSNRGWRICNQTTDSENPEENALSRDSAAPGAAVDAQNTSIDPDLQAIIERWPELPDAVKAGILAMVRTSGNAK